MSKHFFFFLFLILSHQSLVGQDLQLYIDTVYAPENGQIIVPVKCNDFENIAGLQFSLKWDTSHLHLNEPTDFGLPFLSIDNFGTTQSSQGILSFVWNSDIAQGGESLPDGALVFGVKFDVQDDCTQTSTFKFTDTPSEQATFSLINNDLIEIPTNYENGTIISFCPVSIPDILINEPLCEGDTSGSISLFPQGGIVPYQINWSTGANGNQLTNLAGGIYSYSITDGAGNTLSGTIDIPDGPSLAISLGSDITSCDSFYQLVALTTDTFNTYNWYSGNNFLASTTSPEIGVTSEGYFSIVAMNSPSCLATDTIQLTFPQPFAASISSSKPVACEGDTIILNAMGAAQVEWMNGVEFLSSSSISNPLAFPPLPTEFTAIVSNECFSDTATIFIDHVIPFVEASPDTCIVSGASIELFAVGGDQYKWEGPAIGPGMDTSNIPVIRPTADAIYIVQVTDSYGCTALDSVRVEVVENTLEGIPHINTITPNGDGKNDVLAFEGLDKFSNYKLTVFNRWGNIVYQKFNYKNDWGGTHNGKPLPAGVYFYVLSTHNSELKNSLTILRD
ncbi:MAG: gliding motility-associated C-terminal domain-containing protein [Saprospiraceae bacterium]